MRLSEGQDYPAGQLLRLSEDGEVQVWGKVLGALFGLALLKLPGLVLGVLLGHLADQWFLKRWAQLRHRLQPEDEQILFMYSSFAVMGHLAKARGVVTQAHIAQANRFMQQLGLTTGQQREAQAAFRDGKAVNFPFREQLQAFYQCYRSRSEVLQLFLEVQLGTVWAEGKIVPEQRRLLTVIAQELKIPQPVLEQLLRSYQSRQEQTTGNVQGLTLAGAYQLLDCSPECSELELKRAYRKLMAQHHPDKLVSQGVPAAMLEIAKQRSQEIQAAYEFIKQQRAKAG